MALSPTEQAMLARLLAYNGNAYDATSNPAGFARGGNQQGVFIAALKDVADAADLVAARVDTSEETVAEITGLIQQINAALAAIEAGPVISVNGQTGTVSGLVETAALDALASELQQQLNSLADRRSPFTFAYAFR